MKWMVVPMWPCPMIFEIKETMNDNPLPEDLAGYQCILCGTIAEGDIIVSGLTREKQWAKTLIGSPIHPLAGFDVYRKMECPKAGDHDKGWQQIRLENPLPSDEALTYDDGKEPLAHLPWDAIDLMSQVQAFGYKKYKDFNNYRKGMSTTRQASCVIRHVRDYLKGVDRDHESGLNPLAHAMTRLAFMLQTIADGTAKDDRFKLKKK